MTPTPAKYFQSARSIFTPKCFRAMSIRGNEATKHRRQPSRGRAHRQRSASPTYTLPPEEEGDKQKQKCPAFFFSSSIETLLSKTQQSFSGSALAGRMGPPPEYLCRGADPRDHPKEERTGAAGAPARLKFMGTRLSAAGDQAPATAASSSCRMVPRPSTSPSILVYRSCTPCRFRTSS